MDINRMRNIVILKNLPSNLVDEAFVLLKNNQRIKNVEYADNRLDDFSCNEGKENKDEYVVKEAELLISNYIGQLENQDLCNKKSDNNLIKKYKKLKILSVFLGIAFVISCFLHF